MVYVAHFKVLNTIQWSTFFSENKEPLNCFYLIMFTDKANDAQTKTFYHGVFDGFQQSGKLPCRFV